MFILGMVDDLRALGARRKLLIQLLLGLVAWQAGIRIEQFKLPVLGSFVPLGPLALPVTLFWLVAMTNLINLIDGIDGLAGGIGVLLMALLAWVGMGTGNGFYSLLCLGLMGALLGFLRFNFPPAKIYMGDGGAYFLGFFIGLLSIETSNKGTVVAALAAPVLALTVPILDTTLALVRRATKGLPLFRPDQEHIHHRLLRRVGDKRQVLLLLYALCAVATGFALALYLQDGRSRACRPFPGCGPPGPSSRRTFACAGIPGNSFAWPPGSRPRPPTAGRWMSCGPSMSGWPPAWASMPSARASMGRKNPGPPLLLPPRRPAGGSTIHGPLPAGWTSSSSAARTG
jgi:UDP-N-acetylmuramyl pentapeptide phosphotransferase/UDP-N-acetylglucosamine-1-phosphate transferase